MHELTIIIIISYETIAQISGLNNNFFHTLEPT
jgi:hypothetical protein